MSFPLDQQIQRLITEAPDDGKTPQAMIAIAPALRQVAQQLKHEEYYILRSLTKNWQITTLQNRQQPDLTKTAIYGYAELADATKAGQDPELIAQAVPIIDLLFRFMALPQVDSLILIEKNGNQAESLEIQHTELSALIQQQLLAHLDSDDSAESNPIQLA